jgi:hypothetical protein
MITSNALRDLLRRIEYGGSDPFETMCRAVHVLGTDGNRLRLLQAVDHAERWQDTDLLIGVTASLITERLSDDPFFRVSCYAEPRGGPVLWIRGRNAGYRSHPSPDAARVEGLHPALAMLSTFLQAELERTAEPKAMPVPDPTVVPFPGISFH